MSSRMAARITQQELPYISDFTQNVFTPFETPGTLDTIQVIITRDS